MKVKTKNIFSCIDFFAKIKPQLTHVRKTPPLRSHYFFIFRYADLLLRIKELESWTSDFSLPSSVWLSGFFNPQSFLTAIMQSTARKNELPLDKMSLTCEVSKKYPGESMQVPRDGAYVHGLFIEGARWVFLF